MQINSKQVKKLLSGRVAATMTAANVAAGTTAATTSSLTAAFAAISVALSSAASATDTGIILALRVPVQNELGENMYATAGNKEQVYGMITEPTAGNFLLTLVSDTAGTALLAADMAPTFTSLIMFPAVRFTFDEYPADANVMLITDGKDEVGAPAAAEIRMVTEKLSYAGEVLSNLTYQVAEDAVGSQLQLIINGKVEIDGVTVVAATGVISYNPSTVGYAVDAIDTIHATYPTALVAT